jgi:hypothetical protein
VGVGVELTTLRPKNPVLRNVEDLSSRTKEEAKTHVELHRQ